MARSMKKNKPVRQSPSTVRNKLQGLVKQGTASPLMRTPGLGFPHAMVSQLRYVDSYALIITSGSLAKQVIRWNSTFDPDATGVGHQPLFRDTYAAIYDQYSVIRASVEVKFVNPSGTTIVCGIVSEDDTGSSSNVTTLCEQATGRHTIIPALTGSLSMHTVNMDWDCQSFLHIDPFKSELYKTPVGSNPTEESDLVVWATNFDASSGSVLAHVTLVQEVLWTELTSPTGS